MDCFPLRRLRHARFFRHIRAHSVLRATAASDNDEGVAGGVERIHEGPYYLFFATNDMADAFLQSQNLNPITGISSEGYQGKGMVQSKTAKEQGISLEPEDDL